MSYAALNLSGGDQPQCDSPAARVGFAFRSVIMDIGAMRTTSSTELRRTLTATLDRLVDDHEPVIITRGGGRPAAVLMSIEDFASYEETRYLLHTPANDERLLKAVHELDRCWHRAISTALPD